MFNSYELSKNMRHGTLKCKGRGRFLVWKSYLNLLVVKYKNIIIFVVSLIWIIQTEQPFISCESILKKECHQHPKGWLCDEKKLSILFTHLQDAKCYSHKMIIKPYQQQVLLENLQLSHYRSP
jgi:hypothetical protein